MKIFVDENIPVKTVKELRMLNLSRNLLRFYYRIFKREKAICYR